MAELKIETKITEEVKFVLSDEEKDTLAGARVILKELWADDIPDPGAQGTHVVTTNPSYDDTHPEEYNGKIDAYDAAALIEFILNKVGYYDELEDLCDED